MFGQDNYFFSLLAKDLKKRSKDGLFEIKTKITDFDIKDFFKADAVKKTATIAGVYSYVIEMPGFTKDSIDINIDDSILSINAKNGEKTFEYDVFLGEDTIEKVTLELGILDIKINEVTPKEKPKKVNID